MAKLQATGLASAAQLLRASYTPLAYKNRMPTISRFYGIKVQMLFRDHNPPHFHVEYGEFLAVFDIRTLGMTEGALPKKAQLLVIEWALLHREELMTAWNLAADGKTPNKIEPLE